MSEIVWEPQPRQRLVISCPYEEILYGGAAGGGKSDCLIGDWLAHSQKYGKDARGVLFRNSYGELQEIQMRMHVIYGAIGGEFKEKTMTWTFPNGSTLRLSYLDGFEDALKHRGFEYTARYHDELTMRPSDEEYIFLDSRMRSSAGVPTRVVCTSNPGGPGHNWVLKHWKIDEFPGGMRPIHTYFNIQTNEVLEREDSCIFDDLPDADLPHGIRRKSRIFIPGRLKDNKFLDTDGHYRARLLSLPETQRKMLLDGRWDVIEGAFFDEWNPVVHVVRSRPIPKDWKRWMGADWGSTSPYSFLWAAQSPHGDVHIYRELYGCVPGKNNTGTREAPSVVAERIIDIENESDECLNERYLDASCFDNEEMGTSVAEQFRRAGVHFERSNKKFKSGSISLLRDYLKVVNGKSRMVIHDCCRDLIRTLPSLQVNRNNVEQFDSDGEDHAVDALLYLIRRNIRTREELERESGNQLRNARYLKRFGAFGVH